MDGESDVRFFFPNSCKEKPCFEKTLSNLLKNFMKRGTKELYIIERLKVCQKKKLYYIIFSSLVI